MMPHCRSAWRVRLRSERPKRQPLIEKDGLDENKFKTTPVQFFIRNEGGSHKNTTSDGVGNHGKRPVGGSTSRRFVTWTERFVFSSSPTLDLNESVKIDSREDKSEYIGSAKFVEVEISFESGKSCI